MRATLSLVLSAVVGASLQGCGASSPSPSGTNSGIAGVSGSGLGGSFGSSGSSGSVGAGGSTSDVEGGIANGGTSGQADAADGAAGSGAPQETVLWSLGKTVGTPVLDGDGIYVVTTGTMGMYSSAMVWTLSKIPTGGGTPLAIGSASEALTYAGSDADTWYAVRQYSASDPFDPLIVSITKANPGTLNTFATQVSTTPAILAQSTGYLYVLDNVYGGISSDLEAFPKPGPNTGAAWGSGAVYGVASFVSAVFVDSNNLVRWLELRAQTATSAIDTVLSFHATVAGAGQTMDGMFPNMCTSCFGEPAAADWICLCSTPTETDLVRVTPDGTTQGLIAPLPQHLGSMLGHYNGALYFVNAATDPTTLAQVETITACDPVAKSCQTQTVPNWSIFGVDDKYIYFQESDGSIKSSPLALQ